jgi:hypothetical protein
MPEGKMADCLFNIAGPSAFAIYTIEITDFSFDR